ncbi:MAG TPA: hypothetical protein VLM05_20195 [Mycobacteriales bacterium]|nr:hypothetical protein [Mycobacteriales bacterium]
MTTFAVWVIAIVTGLGPQSNVTTPPAATAATTAAEVQPAGLPVPITRVGREVSTRAPPPGAGGPAGAGFAGAAFGAGVRGAATTLPADGIGGAGVAVVVTAAGALGLLGAGAAASTAPTLGRAGDPQPARAAIPATTRHTRRNRTAGG